MLHEHLVTYLHDVEQAINRCETAYIEQYIEEVLTPERVNLRIRLRFAQGHLLAINEAVVITDGQLASLDYRYHCQDAQNCLIFRYDSTPHFPALETFPHHKHLPNNVIAHGKPDIITVIDEAKLAMDCTA